MFKETEQTAGSYTIEVVSLPEECDNEAALPLEIRYILKQSPEYKEKICTILTGGKKIGVRTITKTPENILKAVHTVSVHSQKNFIVTWLPELLRNKHLPHVLEADYMRARAHGEDLDQAVETILRDRLRFKEILLIDDEKRGVIAQENMLVAELSEIIYPLAVDYSVFRVIADNARERTEIAQAIVKALLIVGPIAHILEKFAAGVGKVFAASADDLLGEAAELMALRGSGFSWKELASRSKLLIPVFLLAVWGSFSVEGLLEEGRLIAGGAIFGLSAVALSLTTAVQSFFMYRKNIALLNQENKLTFNQKTRQTELALRQDFTNPARLGLLLGALCAPLFGIAGAFSGYMHNGWVLAGIGSTESIVAGLTVIFADKINERKFRNRLWRTLK